MPLKFNEPKLFGPIGLNADTLELEVLSAETISGLILTKTYQQTYITSFK